MKSIEEWKKFVALSKKNSPTGNIEISVPTEDFEALLNDFEQVSESNLKRKCKIESLTRQLHPSKWDFCVCKAKKCIHSENCKDACPHSRECTHSAGAYRTGASEVIRDFYEKYDGRVIKHADGRWERVDPKTI